MTVAEVAAEWRVHPETVRRLIRRGLLGFERVGRRGIRITEKHLAEYQDKVKGGTWK